MAKSYNKTTLTAQKIFLDLLPAPWSVQENQYDYGVDYDISSSIVCSVNVKGTEQPQYKGNNINCVIDTSKLDFYYKQTTKPIFIILVDTVLRKAYWLFIQEYIENILDKEQPNWRNKKTINLKIPQDNNLMDSFNEFSEAVSRAANLIVLFQYKLPFKTVSTSLQSAVNNPQLLESHQSCNSNSCSSSTCSCSSTDEVALSEDYLTAGEHYFHEYISSLNQQDHTGCFEAVHELTNSILKTVDEGEYFITAELTLRLADIYFSAFTHLSKIVGVNNAFALMDSGQILLNQAHDLITELETPNCVIN